MSAYAKRYRTFEDFEREELNGSITVGLDEMNENLFDFVDDMDARTDEGDAAELPF